MRAASAHRGTVQRLPIGLVSDVDDAFRLYERLSTEHRTECAPVAFGGEGFVRIAGQAYNTPTCPTPSAGERVHCGGEAAVVLGGGTPTLARWVNGR